jgi:diguanylate cyclase (GGDEF)-like protein
MLDIDHFRDINAVYGSQGGDAAIAELAASFPPLFLEGEVAARLSGDEFAVFMPSGGIERALELGEALRAEAEGLCLECISSPDPGAPPVRLTLSIGAAASPDHASNPRDLVAAADRALYDAKEAGRNRVCPASST